MDRIVIRPEGSLRELSAQQSTLRLSSAGIPWDGFILEKHEAPPAEFPACQFSSHIVGVGRLSTPCSVSWKEDGVSRNGTTAPGSIFVRSQQPLGLIRWDGPQRMLVLSIASDAMERALPQPFTRRPVELLPIVLGQPDPVLEHLIGAIEAEVQAHCPTGRLLLESLGNTTAFYLAQRYATFSFRSLEDKSSLSRERMSRVVDYIEAHLANGLLISELASVACLSPYHFNKMFKRTTGKSVHQYVTARRIEGVKSLLKSSTMSLAEIASALGFSDQSQLTVVFRHWLGETPGAYRRAIGIR